MKNHNKETRIVNGKTYIFTNGRWVIDSSKIELDPHDPDYCWDWDLQNRR